MTIETLRETYARNLRRKGYRPAMPRAGRWYFTLPPDIEAKRLARAAAVAAAGGPLRADTAPRYMILGSRGSVRYGRAWSNSVPVSARFLATIAYLD